MEDPTGTQPAAPVFDMTVGFQDGEILKTRAVGYEANIDEGFYAFRNASGGVVLLCAAHSVKYVIVHDSTSNGEQP